MTEASPRQRRAIGDLIGLGADYLPPDLTRAEATAWLARLRRTPAAERLALDGLWIPHPIGDISGAGLFYWASENTWWRVPRPPQILKPGHTMYVWVWRGAKREPAPNPAAEEWPGGQWAERRQVAAIAPARLADWRRQGIVHAQLISNRIGLPLL